MLSHFFQILAPKINFYVEDILLTKIQRISRGVEFQCQLLRDSGLFEWLLAICFFYRQGIRKCAGNIAIRIL